MSAFQQEDLFLHFGDVVFFALGSVKTGGKSTVLCSLDDLVCAYEVPQDGESGSRGMEGSLNKVWQVVPQLKISDVALVLCRISIRI